MPDETHQSVSKPQPGDGIEVTAPQARQGYNGPISRRMFWILVISSVAAVVLMFGYWATVSGDLRRADASGGGGGGQHGQLVTDPKVASQFDAPAPAPKEPSPEAVAGSRTGR